MNNYQTKPTLKSRIKNAAKSLITAGLISAATLMPMQRAKACTGAEQMGMAGAGGEAKTKNPHTVYWTAGAGLCEIEQPEIAYDHIFKNYAAKFNTRYDNTIAVGMPLRANNEMGIGCMYIDSRKGLKRTKDEETRKEYLLSLGWKVSESKDEKFYAGAGLTFRDEIKIGGNITETNRYISPNFGIVSVMNSVIFEGDELRTGILLQAGSQNLRTSIIETIENLNKKGKFALALSFYDLLDISTSKYGEDTPRHLRIGASQSLETKIGNFTLEAGMTKPKQDMAKAVGLGFEEKNGRYKVNISSRHSGESKNVTVGITKRF